MARATKIKAIWISIILTVALTLATALGNWYRQEAAVDGMKAGQTVMKKEGCLPSRKNGNSIGKVETRLESIDNRLDSIDTRQTAGFNRIMKKLEEK